MFKGPSQDIDAIYTAPTSAVCGVTLETNGKEYLIAGITLTASHIIIATVVPWSSCHLTASPRTSGKLEADGTMHVTLCDFILPWDDTSATQRKSLTQRYEMGCDCKVRQEDVEELKVESPQTKMMLKGDIACSWLCFSFSFFFKFPQITRCTSIPCMITSPAECLWLDWVMEKSVNGQQAKHYACIKRSDDSCAWYRGSAPPKRDFLDIEDP